MTWAQVFVFVVVRITDDDRATASCSSSWASEHCTYLPLSTEGFDCKITKLTVTSFQRSEGETFWQIQWRIRLMNVFGVFLVSVLWKVSRLFFLLLFVCYYHTDVTVPLWWSRGFKCQINNSRGSEELYLFTKSQMLENSFLSWSEVANQQIGRLTRTNSSLDLADSRGKKNHRCSKKSEEFPKRLTKRLQTFPLERYEAFVPLCFVFFLLW